jgi:hypothetical protein
LIAQKIAEGRCRGLRIPAALMKGARGGREPLGIHEGRKPGPRAGKRAGCRHIAHGIEKAGECRPCAPRISRHDAPQYVQRKRHEIAISKHHMT